MTRKFLSAVAVGTAFALTVNPAEADDATVEPAGSALNAVIEQTEEGHETGGTQAASAQGEGEVRLEYPLRCEDTTGACIPNETYRCPNPDDQYVIVWSRLPGGEWQVLRQGCVAAGVSEPRAVTPDIVLSALRRIGLPALRVETTPANQTLVNLETVFFTSPTPVSRTLTLLGQSVEVEATPSSYLWHFGDGESESTDFPGSPYPAMDLTHRYLKADESVQPSVDTTYTARFRVNGGAWQDVDGTVRIVGPPITLEVLEATPVLSGNR